MTPPYVPGAITVVVALTTLAFSPAVDPATAQTWSDRGVILAILVTVFIETWCVLKYIASLHKQHLTSTVAAINENTTVTREMVTLLKKQIAFNEEVANRAITDRLELPHRTRVRSGRIKLPPPVNDLPKAEYGE